MRIVIYAPAYNFSAGTRYRVNMMKKALDERFEIDLLCDKHEIALRRVYHLLGPSLLTRKWIWKKAGERIAKQILSKKPDAAILITDVTAGAIPFLREKGILTILEIEDLSAEWLEMSNVKTISQILQSYSILSNAVITVSSKLQGKLTQMGIDSKVVPHGLERVFVDPQEAMEREKNSPIVLHAGQLQFQEEKLVFENFVSQIAQRYRVASYYSGKFAKPLCKKFPQLQWFTFPNSDEAIPNLKGCSIGLLIRFRTHNPTRIYFHASMLQPVIAIGDNWLNEISENSIGVIANNMNALEAIDKIIHNYREYVRAIHAYAEKNTLKKAYAPLIKLLESK